MGWKLTYSNINIATINMSFLTGAWECLHVMSLIESQNPPFHFPSYLTILKVLQQILYKAVPIFGYVVHSTISNLIMGSQ